jgi:predicted nucleotidyltransferase
VSIELLKSGAAALGGLLDEVVFVGGATLTLWITDPGAPPVRPTKDVDVIVEVATRRRYHQFEERLRKTGFRDEGQVICRWIHRETGLILDAMPTDAELLGFTNRWQAESFSHAVERELPSGARIRAVPPPFLLATKAEAFRGRGRNDYVGSRDFADIVALFDGRAELIDEVRAAPTELRHYLAAELGALLENDRALDGVYAQLLPDAASQERAETIVIPRIREIVAIGAV